MMSRRQERELRQWLEDLPDELVRARPVLHMAVVRVLMAAQEPRGVAERLDQIEGGLSTTPQPTLEVRVVDQQEFRRLPASVELYRAALALTEGDPSGTVVHADRAAALAPADADVIRASACALRGLTSWAAGDLENAHRSYTECMAGLERGGFIADVLGCATTTAEIRTTQGRLGEALQAYEAALVLAQEHGTAVRGMADMHVGIAQILESGATSPRPASIFWGVNSSVTPSACRRTRTAGASRWRSSDRPRATLPLRWSWSTRPTAVYVGGLLPDLRPVPALKARLWAAGPEPGGARLGHRARARRRRRAQLRARVRARHLGPVPAGTASRRGDTGSLRDATRLLVRLLHAAEEGGRTGSVIEILALLALAHRATETSRAP